MKPGVAAHVLRDFDRKYTSYTDISENTQENKEKKYMRPSACNDPQMRMLRF